MNKKAQFYLVAIIIIAAIFMGFATIVNYGKRIQSFNQDDLLNELNIEKRYLLDYVSYNQLTPLEIEDTFTNFSENYILKIGENKNILFLFGESGNLKLMGNKLSINNIRVDDENGYSELTEEGNFEKSYNSLNEFKIKIDENEYKFEIREGQNFYYLIDYLNDKERYIIYG